MLLRFSAANHRSLREPQTLSLIASSLDDNDQGLIACGAAPTGHVVPAAVIYGANASGKTNIVKALQWMRSAVLLSHRQGEPGGVIPRSPYKLDSATQNRPSVFELDFFFGEMRYHYGFEALDKEFVSEWLYAFPRGRRQMLFQRQLQEFRFGRALDGKNRVISQLTRQNSLFVSAAAQNDHKRLSEISDYFRSIKFCSRISINPETFHDKEQLDQRVINFLSHIGTGITGYTYTPLEYSAEEVGKFKEFASAVAKLMDDETISSDMLVKRFKGKLKLSHRDRDGGDILFDINYESAGTRRLLVILDAVFAALDKGTPVIIDELDASLHTQACEAILQMFSSLQDNPRGAQLISTTHDTNLLSSLLLRRDQVWFTEKDSGGATHLYPLTDIRSRKGDNIERGYLQGRYGAIPFSGRLSEVISG